MLLALLLELPNAVVIAGLVIFLDQYLVGGMGLLGKDIRRLTR